MEAQLIATSLPRRNAVFCTRTLSLDDGEVVEVDEPLKPDGSLNPIPLGSRVSVYEDHFAEGPHSISFSRLKRVK